MIQPVVIASYQPGATPIVIDKVILPGALDRPQLVRRISANQLDIDENDRWPAPLDEIVQRVLAQDLAARMPAGVVVLPGEPIPRGAVRQVFVDVATFEGDLSGHVTLHARWIIETNPANAPSSSPSIADDAYITVDAGSGNAQAIAAAMSQSLADLSERMATALSSPSQASRGRESRKGWPSCAYGIRPSNPS
jgi:hypothetical protein